MTTRVYERYTCKFKDSGGLLRRYQYFKNDTPHVDSLIIVTGQQFLFLESLKSQGKWKGEIILGGEEGFSIVDSYKFLPYDLPEGHEALGQTERIGQRWYLTDMTMEEYDIQELAWFTNLDMVEDCNHVLAGLDQMRNDPNVEWLMDWTLVSTTP